MRWLSTSKVRIDSIWSSKRSIGKAGGCPSETDRSSRRGCRIRREKPPGSRADSRPARAASAGDRHRAFALLDEKRERREIRGRRQSVQRRRRRDDHHIAIAARHAVERCKPFRHQILMRRKVIVRQRFPVGQDGDLQPGSEPRDFGGEALRGQRIGADDRRQLPTLRGIGRGLRKRQSVGRAGERRLRPGPRRAYRDEPAATRARMSRRERKRGTAAASGTAEAGSAASQPPARSAEWPAALNCGSARSSWSGGGTEAHEFAPTCHCGAARRCPWMGRRRALVVTRPTYVQLTRSVSRRRDTSTRTLRRRQLRVRRLLLARRPPVPARCDRS